MKKILIQLDSDPHASIFDAIVAHDAGADAVHSYGGVKPSDVRGLILSACFTRGIPDQHTIAGWIGGSDVRLGEQLLAEAKKTFFGPFKISLMLDSNGCNTTASTAIAKLARQTDLKGKTATVIGLGPLGIRSAMLLAGEGCRVCLASIPDSLFGEQFDQDLAQRTLEGARRIVEVFRSGPLAETGGMLEILETTGMPMLEEYVSDSTIGVAAGPAGLRLLPRNSWMAKPNLKWVLDFNLTEPLGIGGIRPDDDFVKYGDCCAMGALAVGNAKMKVHKECVARLFERNDLILDAEGVYNIAKKLV